jgi:hypothetical protein
MDAAWEQRDEITEAIKNAGFAFAAQDLEGYRSGSLNETLADAQRQTASEPPVSTDRDETAQDAGEGPCPDPQDARTRITSPAL